MKNLIILVFFLSLAIDSNSQALSQIDDIGTLQEGLTAIKKENNWGFIDTSGTLVIDFRDDIAMSPKQLPAFNNGLCLISEMKDGVNYFGYINNKGEKVIPTKYLVATPFENGFARVIEHYKIETGNTNTLGKKIIKYSYNELVIDTNNKTVRHLRGPINLLFDKLTLQQNPPIIKSSFINGNLISVKESDNTYTIYNLKD